MYNLFLSFNGRLGRPAFWLANGILLFLQMFLTIALLPLTAPGETSLSALSATVSGTGSIVLADLISTLLLLYPLIAVGVKRLADLGRNPMQILVYHLPGLFGQLTDLAGFGGSFADRSNTGFAFDILGLLVFALYIYDLGVQPGELSRKN